MVQRTTYNRQFGTGTGSCLVGSWYECDGNNTHVKPEIVDIRLCDCDKIKCKRSPVTRMGLPLSICYYPYFISVTAMLLRKIGSQFTKTS